MVMITFLDDDDCKFGSGAPWNFYTILEYQGVPPCDIIVEVPSCQNDCCSIRNCTSTLPRMRQIKRPTTYKTFGNRLAFDLPGTISAVSSVALVWPPSNTIESGREVGVQATWRHLGWLWFCFRKCDRGEAFYWDAPHGVEWSPAGVACSPGNARVRKRKRNTQ